MLDVLHSYLRSLLEEVFVRSPHEDGLTACRLYLPVAPRRSQVVRGQHSLTESVRSPAPVLWRRGLSRPGCAEMSRLQRTAALRDPRSNAGRQEDPGSSAPVAGH